MRSPCVATCNGRGLLTGGGVSAAVVHGVSDEPRWRCASAPVLNELREARHLGPAEAAEVAPARGGASAVFTGRIASTTSSPAGAGPGRRGGKIGALLLGIPTEDGLRYVGKVGTGFDERTLADLQRRLAKSPKTARSPRLLARSPGTPIGSPPDSSARSRSRRTSGGHLRQPSWRGIRTDKKPQEVALE